MEFGQFGSHFYGLPTGKTVPGKGPDDCATVETIALQTLHIKGSLNGLSLKVVSLKIIAEYATNKKCHFTYLEFFFLYTLCMISQALSQENRNTTQNDHNKKEEEGSPHARISRTGSDFQ